MSRTDKTAPWSVKAFFYPDWVEEYHYHAGRECDLPPRPTHDNLIHWGALHCGWAYSRAFIYSDLAKCACPMCQGYFYDFNNPKHPRRQRRNARRYTKELWRDEY